jgi:hypothetical protein
MNDAVEIKVTKIEMPPADQVTISKTTWHGMRREIVKSYPTITSARWDAEVD